MGVRITLQCLPRGENKASKLVQFLEEVLESDAVWGVQVIIPDDQGDFQSDWEE
jgi:hypothetical protein